MNARYTVIGGFLGFVLAATVLTPKTAADADGGKGIFGALKVGQMVEVRIDPKVGMLINSYDDPAFKSVMTQKVAEIERDYIVLQFVTEAGAEGEMRYPASTLVGVCHMKMGAAAPKPATPKKKKSAD